VCEYRCSRTHCSESNVSGFRSRAHEVACTLGPISSVTIMTWIRRQASQSFGAQWQWVASSAFTEHASSFKTLNAGQFFWIFTTSLSLNIDWREGIRRRGVPRARHSVSGALHCALQSRLFGHLFRFHELRHSCDRVGVEGALAFETPWFRAAREKRQLGEHTLRDRCCNETGRFPLKTSRHWVVNTRTAGALGYGTEVKPVTCIWSTYLIPDPDP